MLRIFVDSCLLRVTNVDSCLPRVKFLSIRVCRIKFLSIHVCRVKNFVDSCPKTSIRVCRVKFLSIRVCRASQMSIRVCRASDFCRSVFTARQIFFDSCLQVDYRVFSTSKRRIVNELLKQFFVLPY